jgi:hypothetical protein
MSSPNRCEPTVALKGNDTIKYRLARGVEPETAGRHAAHDRVVDREPPGGGFRVGEADLVRLHHAIVRGGPFARLRRRTASPNREKTLYPFAFLLGEGRSPGAYHFGANSAYRAKAPKYVQHGLQNTSPDQT